jgi:hypothetical protein
LTSFNQAKLETLKIVYETGETTPGDLEDYLSITLHCASNRLRRAYKQGLLERYYDTYSYIYMITEKGINRMNYLETLNTVESLKALKSKRCKITRPRAIDQDEDDGIYYEELDEEYEENIELEQFLLNVANERCPVTRKEDEDMEELFKKIIGNRCKVPR